jgi:hypothetical protein
LFLEHQEIAMTITPKPTSSLAPQAAPHSTPQPDWDVFARTLLAAVRGATWAGWTTYPAQVAQAAPPGGASGTNRSGGTLASEPPARTATAATPPDASGPVGDAYDPDCVDALLDQMEREAALAHSMGGLLLPPCPDARPERPSKWHPKPVTLLAILRLARTFAHP